MVDVECVMVGHRTVRVFIERVGSDSASLGDCATASHALGEKLEAEKIPGPYDLEVSSPGLERNLRTQEDFSKFEGREVRLRLVAPIEGRANVRGRLVKVEGDGIEVFFDRQTLRVPIEGIKKANLIWEEAKHAV